MLGGTLVAAVGFLVIKISEMEPQLFGETLLIQQTTKFGMMAQLTGIFGTLRLIRVGSGMQKKKSLDGVEVVNGAQPKPI